jgi:hypothetical protein
LVYPAILGIPLIFVQLIDSSTDTIQIVSGIYCGLVIIWSTIFVEHWKRKEGYLSVEWGQMDFEEDEVDRPTFKGSGRRSPIDDNPNELWYSPTIRMFKTILGFSISLIIIGLVILCVAFIL